MADLKLAGTLNLQGTLTLKGDGGKVLVSGAEALVEVMPSDPAQCKTAGPVTIPPPPAAPNFSPTARVLNSFNKTVKAGNQCIVALGMVMQDGSSSTPTWPGMMLPSSSNTTITVNHIAINVVNDMAIVFPSGGSAKFDQSGQS